MATKSSTTKADFLRHLLMTLLNFSSSSFWVILVNVAHCLEVRKWFTNGTHGCISQIYAGFKFMPNSYFGTLFKGSLHSKHMISLQYCGTIFLKGIFEDCLIVVGFGPIIWRMYRPLNFLEADKGHKPFSSILTFFVLETFHLYLEDSRLFDLI